MKIMIINPPRVDGCTVVREERFEHRDMGSAYPPLSNLQVAAMVERAGYELKFLDAMGPDASLQEVAMAMDQFKPDVVYSRVAFDCQEPDAKVLDYAKEKFGALTITRCKIIAEADFVLRQFMSKYTNVDIFCMIEPDAVIVPILQAFEQKKNWREVRGIAYRENGEVKISETALLCENLDELPMPAWHLLPTLELYHTGVLEAPFATIQTSRGCPFQCEFCAYRKNKFRYLSAERVFDEIKWLVENRGLKSFLIFDDVVGLEKGRFEKILQLIIDSGFKLKWSCCTRANLLTGEQLSLMKKAGCEEIAVGIESGSQEVLARSKKNIKLEEIARAAKMIRKHKILFYGMCIIGLPGETADTIKETFRFIKKINPFYTQFCFSTPLPNTPNFHWYKMNGYLLTEDWSKYSSLYPEPVVRTEALSAEELSYWRNWIYRRLLFRPFYLLSKIRPFDWKWNIEGFKKIMERIKAILTKSVVR